MRPINKLCNKHIMQLHNELHTMINTALNFLTVIDGYEEYECINPRSFHKKLIREMHKRNLIAALCPKLKRAYYVSAHAFNVFTSLRLRTSNCAACKKEDKKNRINK